ncbi:MAG: hypothetical protein H7A47_10605 [Verrucomicrobiales bacterium]|nr:hypothetical protein [Verrucomicrobiales bacterium]
MNEHQPKTGADWEAQLEERLRNLPDRPAPRTLIPGVMARLRALEAAPWWQQSWWAWPRGVQAMSVILSSGAILLLNLLFVEVREALAASYLHVALQDWTAQFEPVWRMLGALSTAAELVLQRLCGAACVYVMAAGLAVYLACVGLGTWLFRLVLPARIHS